MPEITADLLSRTIVGNPVWAWLLALAILLGVLGFLLLGRALISKGLERRFRRRGTGWAGLAAELIRRTTFLFLLVVSLFASSLSLTVPENVAQAIRSLTLTIFLIQLGVWTGSFVTLWLSRPARKGKPKAMRPRSPPFPPWALSAKL